jgi:protoporphyrinogen oxidase
MLQVKETLVGTAILGAGPTGIGAAWRLSQHSSSNHPNDSLLPFLLLDECTTPGGRAASYTTPEGFTFDYGGHVLFPHAEYSEFIELIDKVVPEWHWSVPIRGVWIANRFLPTPVQRNIHRLPLSVLAECVWGLMRRSPVETNGAEPNLQLYLEGQFGEALTRHVMAPLNHKMWAHDPRDLGSAWSLHRSGSHERNIPDVRVRDVLRNLLLNRNDPGWRQSTKVRYPLTGGCGAIWRAIFDLLPDNVRRLGSRALTLEAQKKKIWFADGSGVRYQHLLSSIPLDRLLGLMRDRPDLQARSREFRAARVQLFGFGLTCPMPAVLRDVHAINVPSSDVPFWRLNLPSSFSPGNVPDPDRTWSILCECSLGQGSAKRYQPDQIEAALRQMGFLAPSTKVVSIFTSEVEHGYPVPFAGRDKLLNEVQRELEELGIYSRGRFGGWRYEVSNQDHAFMQGVEVVDRLRDGKAESTYRKTW